MASVVPVQLDRAKRNVARFPRLRKEKKGEKREKRKFTQCSGWNEAGINGN